MVNDNEKYQIATLVKRLKAQAKLQVIDNNLRLFDEMRGQMPDCATIMAVFKPCLKKQVIVSSS